MATPYNTGPVDNPLIAVIVRVERVFFQPVLGCGLICYQGLLEPGSNKLFYLRFTAVVDDEKSRASSGHYPYPSAE